MEEYEEDAQHVALVLNEERSGQDGDDGLPSGAGEGSRRQATSEKFQAAFSYTNETGRQRTEQWTPMSSG